MHGVKLRPLPSIRSTILCGWGAKRLLNWNRLRPPCRISCVPSRASLVSDPPFSISSQFGVVDAPAPGHAQAPHRFPLMPPPAAVVNIVEFRQSVSVRTSGVLIVVRSAGGKELVELRWLTVIVPEPGLRKTRADDVFRRPVA